MAIATDTVELDPIRLQVAWTRAISSVDEATAVLIRTAVSTIIRESLDLAIVLFDVRGRAIAQSTVCIPSFIGTLPLTMRHFLSWKPAATWRPGDVVATNDPWLGTGQLNDLTVVLPIFRDGILAGFSGVVAHLPDVGGIGAGAHATDTFEEGLHVPMCHLHEAGARSDLAYQFIVENVRLPNAVLSDIAALVASADACRRKALDLLAWLGQDTLAPLADQMLRLSEAAMRRAILEMPDGTLQDHATIEGFDGDLEIVSRLTVSEDRIEVDYAGTSPQVDRAINSTLAHTTAHTSFALKCILSPEAPNNDGSFRPLTVRAPEGSILNSRRPAAGRSRTHVSHNISNLLFRMLGSILPERTLAEGGSPRPVLTFRGEQGGHAYTNTYQVMAGMGAGAGADGLSVTAFPTNTRTTPVELMEHTVPIRFLEKTLRPGSGGAGRFRGGLGQSVRIEIASDEPVRVLSSPGRTRFGAAGVGGGGAGMPGSLALNGKDIAFATHPVVARRGDVLHVCSAGGGGTGSAADRWEELKSRDEVEGLAGC